MPSLLGSLFAPRRPRKPRELLLSTLRVLDQELPVTRKSVRSLRLTFSKEGHLRATAPWRMKDAEIVGFVESRATWVRKHQTRFQRMNAAAAKEAEGAARK